MKKIDYHILLIAMTFVLACCSYSDDSPCYDYRDDVYPFYANDLNYRFDTIMTYVLLDSIGPIDTIEMRKTNSKGFFIYGGSCGEEVEVFLMTLNDEKELNKIVINEQSADVEAQSPIDNGGVVKLDVIINGGVFANGTFKGSDWSYKNSFRFSDDSGLVVITDVTKKFKLKRIK
ncbi:hypothetical protein GC194_05610 [bacterium]|nr:hypothetical protein [bacterium]